MRTYTYPTWFFSPVEGQLVTVASSTSVARDPDTGEYFSDLTLEFMRESDDWFEYASREEALA